MFLHLLYDSEQMMTCHLQKQLHMILQFLLLLIHHQEIFLLKHLLELLYWIIWLYQWFILCYRKERIVFSWLNRHQSDAANFRSFSYKHFTDTERWKFWNFDFYLSIRELFEAELSRIHVDFAYLLILFIDSFAVLLVKLFEKYSLFACLFVLLNIFTNMKIFVFFKRIRGKW
jgi:hypothetical protein